MLSGTRAEFVYSTAAVRPHTAPVMLGILLSADLASGIDPARVDWGARAQGALQRLQKVSSLPILHLAADWPRPLMRCLPFCIWNVTRVARTVGVAQIQAHVAKLVDAGRGPSHTQASERVFLGVSLEYQFSSPRLGGFGVLPLRQHVAARHFMWAVRLAIALHLQPVPLWARILGLQIDRLHKANHFLLLSSIGGHLNIFTHRTLSAELADM